MAEFPKYSIGNGEDFYYKNNVLEAMEIAMKQAYNAGQNSVCGILGRAARNEKLFVSADEYLIKLENSIHGE